MSIKTVGSKGEKIRKRLTGTLVFAGAIAAMLPFTGAALPKFSYIINESVDGNLNQLAVVYTLEDHPYDILQDEQIMLDAGDTYTFSEAEFGNSGTITITRAFPVYITADGKTNEVMVQGGTVADALKSGWITLGEQDIVSMPLSDAVHSGSSIRVQRVTTKTVTKEKAIAYETKYEYTNKLVPNAKVRTTEGKEGTVTYTYERTYIDGKLLESKLVSEEVTEQPVDEVYQIGSTKNVVSVFDTPADMEFDENGNPVNYKKKVSGKATAYSTRRKTSLVEGCVAMDLSKYPRGSWLYIKSSDGSYVYGYAKVADTGTALVQGKVLVDCFFDTFAECYQFGAKTLDVYVLS